MAAPRLREEVAYRGVIARSSRRPAPETNVPPVRRRYRPEPEEETWREDGKEEEEGWDEDEDIPANPARPASSTIRWSRQPVPARSGGQSAAPARPDPRIVVHKTS